MKFVTGDADTKVVKVRGYGKLPLPMGSMINGIITDEDAMTRFLAQTAGEYALGKEQALLVLNNNGIQAKSLEVPHVSDDMILEFIHREYSQHDESTQEQYVYDYTTLSRKGPAGGMQILAVRVARELLDSYRRVFAGAGLDLKRIDIGLNCQIKLAGFTPQLQKGSVILAFIDGRALEVTLFENGRYVVANRYRLTGAEDDSELIQEIGRNISSMLQFIKTQQGSADITAACIAGISEARVNALRFSLTYLGIEIERFDLSQRIKLRTASKDSETSGNFDEEEYFLNLGNLLKG
jgi:Tfp pilus assembly PilM family ATPase